MEFTSDRIQLWIYDETRDADTPEDPQAIMVDAGTAPIVGDRIEVGVDMDDPHYIVKRRVWSFDPDFDHPSLWLYCERVPRDDC